MARAEVIVVDNGSRAPPAAVVADFPGVLLAEEATPGPGPARNRGVALSRAPILAFTDGDCRVDRDWLATILRHFAADPGLDDPRRRHAAVPRRPGHPTAVEAYECVYAFPQTLYIFKKGYSVTANMAARRRCSTRSARSPASDLRGPRLGPAGARPGPRHPLAARRDRPPPGAADDGRAARQDRPQRQPRLPHATRPASPGKRAWTAKAWRSAVSPLAEIPRIAAHRPRRGFRARRPALQGLAGLRLYRARRMLEALVSEEVRTASTRWNRGGAGDG